MAIGDRIRKQHNDREELKQKLAIKYQVVGNPKLDRCFELAWEQGHSSGENEIENYFMDFVELIK